MKRLCLILAYLFLFTQTASAMPLLVGQKVVYRGTITGLRISAVDGTAFIDNLPYLHQSDFSSGVDGYSSGAGTVDGNIDSIDGQDNVLRYTCNTDNTAHYIHKTSIFTIGKRYTVTFKYYIPSSNSVVDEIQGWNTFTIPITSVLNTKDSWTTVTTNFIASAASLRFFALDTGTLNFQDAGGDDVFYIKDVQISEIQHYADGNHSIEIYDSSNRMLKGVLKAAGTSETLGDEILAGWNFTSGWELISAGSIVDADSYISGTETYHGLRTTSALLSALRLYKVSWDGTTASTTVSIRRNNANGDIFVSGFGTGYGTATIAGKIALLNSTVATQTDVSSLSVKQVTAPSSSGCTIVSAKGGTTYNFSYKNASFTYNASSYYVIIRAIR
jgi:hypothetical protein